MNVTATRKVTLRKMMIRLSDVTFTFACIFSHAFCVFIRLPTRHVRSNIVEKILSRLQFKRREKDVSLGEYRVHHVCGF